MVVAGGDGGDVACRCGGGLQLFLLLLLTELRSGLLDFGFHFRVNAGEQDLSAFGHDGAGAGGCEADDEADFAGRTADFIPREPKAIGMAEAGFAVVRGEIRSGEDEFLFGMGFGAVGIVEGIDDDISIDNDGGTTVSIMEHESSAETTNATPAGLFENGVRPEGGDASGDLGFVGGGFPGEVFAEVEFRAADGGEQEDEENAGSHWLPADCRWQSGGRVACCGGSWHWRGAGCMGSC